MTSTSALPWWHEHNASLRASAEEDPCCAEGILSHQILALLDEVEDAFALAGADTPGWGDPHLRADGERRDSRDDEYSRCLDPGKYAILWTRAEAWARVLTVRGWADAVEISDGAQASWAVEPRTGLHRTTVLRPRRPGAQPLVLARTARDAAAIGTRLAPGGIDLASGDAEIPDLVVGLGDPALAVLEPDCLCDACDYGSRDLLEQLDEAILSIVDGSSEVEHGPQGTSQRTSFGASRGSDERATVPRTVTAGPWADGWTPRPLSPPINPIDSSWPDEMLREPWPARLLDRALAVRPGRSGTAVTYAYAPAVEQEVTAPLDALEKLPAGYRRMHRSAVVTGMDFEEASSAVRCWVVHRRSGLQVAASHTPAEPGAEVHLRLGIGPLRILAPWRVLWVIDEPDRAGFAYGTLPGHPESGIEQFTVTRSATGAVRFHLDAVSRPATWYARLGAPFSLLAQEVFTRRYLRALSRLSAPRSRRPRRATGR